MVADIKSIRKNIVDKYPLSKVFITFHDPNFGIQFERLFKAMESIPPEERVPYGMECSLSILNESRLKRLKESKCLIGLYGIESWQEDYSLKVGLKNKGGMEKVNRVAQQMKEISQFIPYVQSNLMFGFDNDMGEDPINLNKEYIRKTPFSWHTMNIPTPYGGTPMFNDYLASDRILKSMPFAFYLTHLVTKIKNYDPVTYLEKMVELTGFLTSSEMLKRRVESTPHRIIKIFHRVRNLGMKGNQRRYSEVLEMLRSDEQFRAFHEGKSQKLPEFYQTKFNRMIGRYQELFSLADQTPCFDQLTPQIV